MVFIDTELVASIFIGNNQFKLIPLTYRKSAHISESVAENVFSSH